MSNRIILAINHGKLSRVRDVPAVRGTINALICEFQFKTPDWDNTTKTAVFMRGNEDPVGVLLNENNECKIPASVLSHDGFFKVGVFGVAENYRIVSELLQYRIEKGCFTDCGMPSEPDPTIYEQIINLLNNKADIDHNHNDLYYTKDEVSDLINEDCYVKDEVDVLLIQKKDKFTIQKLQDYLYYIDYDELDYENGETYFLERYNPDFGACSSVRKGNFYGRNYDWYYDDKASFIINKKATKGRYASIGVAGGIISNDIANGGEYNELYEYLPFLTLDGINEKGVVCNINVLPELDKKGVTTGTNPGKPNVPMACLVRRILDEASSADDAIYKIQHNYNIIAPSREDIAMEMHFMIADKDKTYVVEFVNNTPVIIDEFVDDKPIMTNFYLNDYDGTRASLTPYAMGIERYAILSEGFNAVNSQQDMVDLMRLVLYSKAYSADENPVWCSEFAGQYDRFGTLTKDSSLEDYEPLLEYVREMFAARERDGSTWQTVHSSVYDIAEKKLWISVQEDEKVYEIRFDVLGEKENVVDVSAQIEIYNSSTGKSKYTLTELSQFYNNGITLMYQKHILTVFAANTSLFRAYFFNPINHTVKKFDVKDDKSFLWYADIVLADDSAVSTAIQSEASIRQASDNALSDRIDDVIAKSDVVDVVGTHADLEEYDTSKLGDNDLIKVLQDETKLYNRTYYRWIVADDEFTYVGEEPTVFVEIYDYDTGLSRYTPTELYSIWLQGDGKIFRYKGTLLTVTAVFDNQFSAQYLDKNTGKVYLVTVKNSKSITVEKVVHYARSILTDYGVEIGFYTYADGTERPYIRKVADT